MRGNYEDALSFFKKTKKIKKQINPDSDELAGTFGNIGLTFKAKGNNEKAIKYFKKSIKLKKKLKQINDIDYAKTLNNLALAYK